MSWWGACKSTWLLLPKASTRVTFPIDTRGEQDTKRGPVDRRSKGKFNVEKKKKKCYCVHGWIDAGGGSGQMDRRPARAHGG